MAAAIVAMSLCVLLASCGRETAQTTSLAPTTSPAPATASAPAITDLVKTDIVVGTGPAIAQGQAAVVHYTGWLYDAAAADQKGKEFDSSRQRGVPFRFPVGAGKVIAGWDQGVVGMQVGGQRRLTIPAYLGYGDRGGGGVIPPNATLLFDVELLAIEQPQ
jgi:FKBP-type peptidyl-prolyl cis-trans isomerase